MREDSFLKLTGWVETGGKVLSREEILSLLHENPLALSSFGGEFLLEWDDCCARDALGIIPGPVPPGKILSGKRLIGSVEPRFGDMGLEEAIVAAVALRSDRGVVALSGGVDSALVAAIARRPCIAAGTAESGDLAMGMGTARDLGLECIPAVVAPGELEGAVAKVIGIVPEKTPLDLSIALSCTSSRGLQGMQGTTASSRGRAPMSSSAGTGGTSNQRISMPSSQTISRDCRHRSPVTSLLRCKTGYSSPTPTSTGGSFRLHVHSPHGRKWLRVCGNGRSGKSQSVFSPGKLHGARRRPCSTGPGSGGNCEGSRGERDSQR